MSSVAESESSVRKAPRLPQKDLDLTTGPFLPKIIKYTLPIMATSLLQLLFNAADLVVVGQYCGDLYVGAVGATSALINLMVNLFIGLSVGAGVAVAHGIGAEDNESVHRVIHTAIPTALISGAVLTVVGILASRQFLIWMGTPDEALELSAVYLRIYFAGIIPILLYNYGASILRASGDTRSPLIFLSIAGVLNVLINILLVTAFKMNVDGVALATVISQTAACALVLSELHRRRDACRLQFRKLRIYKKSLLEMLRIGLPAGLQGSLFSISNVIIQSSVNSFGPFVLNGNTASASIEGFVWVSMNAFHQAAMNFTSQNLGAKKYRNVVRIMKICLISVTVTGLVLGTVVNLLGRPLLSLYLTDASQLTYDAGLERMRMVVTLYFLCGIMDTMTGTLRGLGVSISPMLITVLGVCGSRLLWIFTAFQLPEFHSMTWLMVTYPVSWFLTFLAEVVCFLIVWKRIRPPGLPPDGPQDLSSDASRDDTADDPQDLPVT